MAAKSITNTFKTTVYQLKNPVERKHFLPDIVYYHSINIFIPLQLSWEILILVLVM